MNPDRLESVQNIICWNDNDPYLILANNSIAEFDIDLKQQTFQIYF